VENFQFKLGGRNIVKASFEAAALLGDQFAEFTLNYFTWPSDIQLRLNMASGAWQDLQELLQGSCMSASQAQGEDTDNDDQAVLSLMEATEAEGAVRWALAVDDSNKLALQLQALPRGANAVKSKPSLRGKQHNKLKRKSNKKILQNLIK